jgi:cytochrome c biogenesis protein CcdA
MTRTHTSANNNKSFKQNVRLQLHEHKHLLAASCIVVLLGLLRLVITFFTSCMKTTRESWFYLIGYFLSFIPTTLIFFMFVLPSEKYKKEFEITFQRTLKRLHLVAGFAFIVVEFNNRLYIQTNT